MQKFKKPSDESRGPSTQFESVSVQAPSVTLHLPLGTLQPKEEADQQHWLGNRLCGPHRLRASSKVSAFRKYDVSSQLRGFQLSQRAETHLEGFTQLTLSLDPWVGFFYFHMFTAGYHTLGTWYTLRSSHPPARTGMWSGFLLLLWAGLQLLLAVWGSWRRFCTWGPDGRYSGNTGWG